MNGHCNHGYIPDTDDENLDPVGQDISNTLAKKSGQLEVTLETEELALRNVDETTNSWERFRTAEPEMIKEKERKNNALLVRTGFILIMGGIFLMVFGGSVGVVIVTSVLAHQMQTAGSPFWCTDETFTNVSHFSTHEEFALPASALGIGEPELHEKENGLDWVVVIVCNLCLFIIPQVIQQLSLLKAFFFRTNAKVDSKKYVAALLVMEALYSFGSLLLVFRTIPVLDIQQAILAASFSSVTPSFIGLLFDRRKMDRLLTFLAMVGQCSCILIVAIPWRSNGESLMAITTMSIGVILNSARWWESAVSDGHPNSRIHGKLQTLKKHIDIVRDSKYLYIMPLWRVVCTIVFGIMFIAWDHDLHTEDFLVLLQFNDFKFSNDNRILIILTALSIGGSFLVRGFATFACRICMNTIGLAFPVVLVTPLALFSTFETCAYRWCEGASESIPDWIFDSCPDPHEDLQMRDYIYPWMFPIWILSGVWVTRRIWIPIQRRLATQDQLFYSPSTTCLLPHEWLSMNLREPDGDDISQGSKTVPQIYACATMWHETKGEMIAILKSIFEMDRDWEHKKWVKDRMKRKYDDYYKYETHIFFDDAFEVSDHGDDWYQVNQFVRTLLGSIDEAASESYGKKMTVVQQRRQPTPYGGRIVYELPGKTQLIIHLKNKDMIRHKKRWSQVMYMYYLLQYCIRERERSTAENTYILALDGDIDFKPIAVQQLVDLMKKKHHLGAACGRIHPISKKKFNIMVWYQKFEYALGHWLQKSAEHMIGCVLCAPGCFSLFRGSALTEVMEKYTTKSEKPRHFVQFDQGEDRWLCTLMLQRGYRVEYCAASDAYTHCPETFNEFFNQRRRWIPSTIANIFDLLLSWRSVCKSNRNISWPYMLYQLILMFGTIIGPGMILLMLTGALVTSTFGAFSNAQSLGINLIPIALLSLTCMWFDSKYQIKMAMILSSVYALEMMTVIVGTALQLSYDGGSSPSAIFLSFLIGSVILAAVLHPNEFLNVFHGLVYLLFIPSMYMLLMIYSVLNVNVVSWGTREVQAKKTKKELEEEAKQNSKPEPKKWYTRLNNNPLYKFFADVTFFKRNSESPTEVKLRELTATLENLTQKIQDMNEMSKRVEITDVEKSSFELSESVSKPIDGVSEQEEIISPIDFEKPIMDVIDPDRPLWIEDPALGPGPRLPGGLDEDETKFWKALIEKYLKPINADKGREEKMSKGLKDLKDHCAFAFTIINTIFVTMMYLLTWHKDTLHFEWGLNAKLSENQTTTFGNGSTRLISREEALALAESGLEINLSYDYLELEPLGFFIMVLFLVIIIIQVLAMNYHRFKTFTHLLASTELSSRNRKARFNCLWKWWNTKKKEDPIPHLLPLKLSDADKEALINGTRYRTLEEFGSPNSSPNSDNHQ